MAVINRTLAKQVWPAGDAVGQRILMGGGATDSVWRTIVGIVGDVRHRGLDAEARPEIYLPHAQFPAGTGTAMRSLRVVMRTDGEPEGATAALRATLAAIDPDVPLAEVQTMDEALGAWAAERRLTMVLVAGFAVLALSLGAVGVYGVMTHLVVQRTREIGIRMALGAVPREILAPRAVAGRVAGGAGHRRRRPRGALAATRLLAGLLFGVGPTDPVTFVSAIATLAAVAALACLFPALARDPDRSGGRPASRLRAPCPSCFDTSATAGGPSAGRRASPPSPSRRSRSGSVRRPRSSRW